MTMNWTITDVEHSAEDGDSPEALRRELHDAQDLLLDTLDMITTLSIALGKATAAQALQVGRPHR